MSPGGAIHALAEVIQTSVHQAGAGGAQPLLFAAFTTGHSHDIV